MCRKRRSGASEVTGLCLGVWLGCGGAAGQDPRAPDPASGTAQATEAAAPEASTGSTGSSSEATAPAAAADPSGLPSACSAPGELCLPPRAFVKKLCQDAYTGAAFRLFEKSSPFSRGYVRSRRIKAVNTLGGPASDADLSFGEEVLILTHSGGPRAGEMQVSGMGGYEVLRWDGTCATVAEEELALRAPTAPRHAPFEWQWIDENIQKALLADEAIGEARRRHRKHCHGVTLGQRSAACIDAEAQLGERIVVALRSGMSLPVPDRMP
jgi:hypothetical protein